MMGYVPPKSATQLIREDLAPVLTKLFVTFAVTSDFLNPTRRKPDGYRAYVEDLYGHRPTDHFMALNYAFLACLIALPIAIALLILR